MAVIVPMVSKKSASSSVKTNRTAVTTPTRSNEPNSENWPSSPKSGVAMILSGKAGTLRFQPCGLTLSPETDGPTLATASTMIASTVVARIEIRMAPLTFFTHSAMTSIRPNTKTSTGHPPRTPPEPSSTGTGPTPVRRTKPASTRPMSAMNRPMPTLIAVFSSAGTAWNTAVRKPVSTSTRMIRPSRTTRPIASAQDMPDAMENATNALSPSPVASASGKLATTPIRMVSRPATSAVAAAIMARSGASPPPRNWPSPSFAKPRMSGFSTMM